MKMLAKKIAFTVGLVIIGFFSSAQSVEANQLSQGSGTGMILASLIIVLLLLFVMYIILKIINIYTVGKQKKNKEATAALEGKTAVHEEISGEVFAAISTALYLYETEQHDHESTILTINRAAKSYSPWSSKIYGLRQIPRK
ncbi:MAG: OadG family protein [Bacteroidales bacterium]|nr:OadG family protein [Bacteroidales bacterium]